MSATAEETAAVEALAAATPAGLLSAYASLTHRISKAGRDREVTDTLYRERGLIEDEILHRMGTDQ